VIIKKAEYADYHNPYAVQVMRSRARPY